MDTDQCQTVLVHLPNQSVVYDFFREVHLFYKPIHTYLSIIMCIFGTVANFCNIVVLTRRQMRTPVNMILTAMACCDTVVLFSNLIYTTHYSFVAFKHCHPRHWSYGWALFLIAHAHLSLVGHSSSVWLSVMLALIRYMTLRGRGGNSGVMQIHLKHSYMAIGATICFVALVNAPNFLTYKILEIRLNDTCVVRDPALLNAAAYLPGIAEIALAKHCFVFRLVFWISGLVFKVIPCCLLSLFVWLLLGILKEVKENRQRLLKNSRHPSTVNASARNGKVTLVADTHHKRTSSLRVQGRGERTDRTTNMLLAIVFVMLFTEMPQGIMALLSGMVSQEFRRHIYNNLGDLLDLLSLCEACMSFIIYCSMSGQFRNEFHRVFIPKSVHCTERPVSIRRPSDTYTKMSYLKPNELLYENGSSYSDIDRASHAKEIAEKSTSRPEISRVTPSPGGYTSSTPDEQHPEEDERSRLINIQNSVTNGSIKEQQFRNI